MVARLNSSLDTLQKAAGLLDDVELKAELLGQCDRISHPNFTITVFGPFNYGKSTLLNALLGEKTLPIDLLPTTGAAVTVKYGPELASRITLTDGTVLEESGTDLLQRYAVLDEQRCMRQEVTAVEVCCPHPFLQPGVELVDLPGTDDQDSQNELVYRKLLEADVVIQLLDGRKLMTLLEREQLRHWLLERGITTVLFVVNFLNLMAPEERQQVMCRLRRLGQDFRASLPDSVSNLHRVDALPALRARLKGDAAAATQAGLSALESALHTLVQVRHPQLVTYRVPRLLPLLERTRQNLLLQLQSLSAKSQADERRTAIQRRMQELLRQGFQQDVHDLQGWLGLNNLLHQYQHDFANALQNQTTVQWLEETLQPVWKQKERAVTEWVDKACEFFDQLCPVDLRVDCILAGPFGAAVLGSTSHLLNQSGRKKSANQPISSDLCHEAAQTYLAHFSKTALAALEAYKTTARPILNTSIQQSLAQQVGQRRLLENTLLELQSLQEELKKTVERDLHFEPKS